MFKISKYPKSYSSFFAPQKQILTTKRFQISYLGKGSFLITSTGINNLNYKRFDLFTRTKIIIASLLLFSFFMVGAFPFNSSSSTPPDDELPINYSIDVSRAEQKDIKGMSEEEAYKEGDRIRHSIMSSSEKDNSLKDKSPKKNSEDIDQSSSIFHDDIIDISSFLLKNKKEKYKAVVLRHYRPKKTEPLQKIAARFKIDMASIAGSSGITLYNYVPAGKELIIPNQTGYTIKLKHGQSIASIVQRYKLNYNKFIAVNKLKEIDRIKPGTLLFLPDKKAPNIREGWLLPTYSRVVTSGYGWRRNPGKSYHQRHFHEGLDLRARFVPIRSARSGKVIYSGWMGGYGKTIVIQHANGYKTLYGHNSRLYVRRGQYVRIGQKISRSGNTGYSFGAHLHFEISHNGKHVNPARFFRGLRYR